MFWIVLVSYWVDAPHPQLENIADVVGIALYHEPFLVRCGQEDIHDRVQEIQQHYMEQGFGPDDVGTLLMPSRCFSLAEPPERSWIRLDTDVVRR